eukprot:Nitzschia sp. Nitz4//scaffold1_size375055//114579//115535//NITZ4_000246-RA/size375055-processed-gene-0.426-mRNA-1//-1//CDS//3329540955//312//frame0
MGPPRRVSRCILLISLLLVLISSSVCATPSESRSLRRRLGGQDGNEDNAENQDANNNMDAQEDNNDMGQDDDGGEGNDDEEVEGEGDDDEEVEEGDDGAYEDDAAEGDDAVARDDAAEEGDDDNTDDTDTDDSQGDDATQTDDDVSQGDDDSQNSNSNSNQGGSGSYLWARDDDDDVFNTDDASYWRSNQNLKAQGNFDSSYLGQYRSSYSNNANTYTGDASSQLYEDDDYEYYYYYDDDASENINWQKKSSGLGLLNLGDNMGMAVFLFCAMFLLLACCMFGRYFARKCYKLVRGKRRRRKTKNTDLGKSLAESGQV